MRAVDLSSTTHAASLDATSDDGAHAASQFGDSLRAAAQRSGGRDDASPHAGNAPHEAPNEKSTASEPAATPRDASSAKPPEQTASSGGQTSPRAPGSPAAATQSRPDRADLHDARPRAHAPAHGRTSQRDTRRQSDSQRPPDGVALQTLLAAANPLLASAGDAPNAPAPSALTPHDVAASVTQTWLREPSSQDASAGERGAQWTFTLGDPLTPLAALRISGDAAAGWGLQLTAGNALPARELAAYTERLRRRLRARGQAVDRLEVDDDPQR